MWANLLQQNVIIDFFQLAFLRDLHGQEIVNSLITIDHLRA
jgi:hypothetical protein